MDIAFISVGHIENDDSNSFECSSSLWLHKEVSKHVCSGLEGYLDLTFFILSATKK